MISLGLFSVSRSLLGLFRLSLIPRRLKKLRYNGHRSGAFLVPPSQNFYPEKTHDRRSRKCETVRPPYSMPPAAFRTSVPRRLVRETEEVSPLHRELLAAVPRTTGGRDPSGF